MSTQQDLNRCARVARKFYVEDFRCKVMGGRRFLFLGKSLKTNDSGIVVGTQPLLLFVYITPDGVVMFKPIITDKPLEAWLCANYTVH
jgi:hypothetical protein